MTEEGPPAESSPAAGALAAQFETFRAGTDALRKRTDAAAKAIAGVGTAGVSAIGIAKFTDVFPYNGPAWAVAILVCGFLAMAAAVAVLTGRLWRTQQPLVMRSDPNLIDKLNDRWTDKRFGKSERQLVDDVYDDMTVLNDVVSLRAYEARGRRLRRIARRLDDDHAKELIEHADQIGAELAATQARAAHAVIRRRATKAVRGFWSIVFYALFMLGLSAAAVGADRLAAERSADRLAGDRSSVEFFKSCADAFTAGVVEGELPAGCPDLERPPKDSKSQAQQP